ncbi:hypothetical protein B4U79_06115 [Dinothrombium tinctorium]|uniref:Sulfide:quinone oxidoreductase, mitochondrial n=1 Tax=Dinothrombium tinctorium TaxID=1965070 RepID=A0A443RHI1_9ACAR|nr:hypothetical protein B4U79_06115 [Dinothrombium tinctorium]
MVITLSKSSPLLRKAYCAFHFARNVSQSYKLVVAGGGTAGLSVSNCFSRILGKGNVALIEPKNVNFRYFSIIMFQTRFALQVHYYQPLWTFVGGGIKDVKESERPIRNFIPPHCEWIQNSVKEFLPDENAVKLSDNSTINYEYLVVAIGIEMDLDRIKGLKEALNTEGVCSNYMVDTVTKTWKCIQNFKEGNAIFTFPNTPIKCAGAPQKIMYLADDYFRKTNKRDKANIIYNSSLGVIFGAPKYAQSLNEIVKKRNITVNYKHNLIEIKPQTKEAIFEKLETGEKVPFKYDMIHVTPPQKPPAVLKPLADSAGFVNVDKETLQHTKYSNIFSLGDCSNLPTSKTAAAVAAESGVLVENLNAFMNKSPMKRKYTGYTSCPLITSYNTCILAEFDYNLQPLETFPIDQGKERTSMYYMTKDAIPFIYWNLLTRCLYYGVD